MEAPRRSRSVSITPKKAQPSDYERQFKPFYMPSNTTLAPYNRPSRDDKGLAVTRDKIDEGLKVNLEAEKTAERQGSATMLELLPSSRNKVHRPPAQVFAVKDIMEKIDGTTSRPIDLTGAQLNQATDNPLHLLASISMKCLKFAEDVRPPYIGTYTRLRGAQSISRLARNPFGRGLPNTNYDYDSEAEWEDPIDGEDLDSEGEEDADDDGDADEMAGFLDDEEATDLARAGNRRPVLGNQEPTCTGICWEGPRGHIDQGLAALDWRLLKLDILMGKRPSHVLADSQADLSENPRLPINPYCSEYWLPTTSSSSLQLTPHAQSTLMEPPRFPLHPVNRNNAQLSSSALTRSTYGSIPDRSAPMKATKPQRQIPPELMDDFKVAVQGNDLTKVGLLEILKKKYVLLLSLKIKPHADELFRFPKQPKDAIKDTLEMIAERVGPKTAEKKWMLKSGI